MLDFAGFLTPESIATFLTLTFLEIVLAGDNLVLIAVLSSKLAEGQRPAARRLGLLAAVSTRILLLLSLFWLSHVEKPLPITGLWFDVTPRVIIFTLGGAFLVWKALTELVAILFGHDIPVDTRVRPRNIFLWVIVQIAIFDIVFSLDSVIAAIGIARHVEIMIAAVLAGALVMFFLVNPISTFIERHRIVKVAALDLLVLVGVFLIAEAFHVPLPKIELYVALVAVIAVQAVLLLLGAVPRTLRYGLIMAATVALGVVAVILVNDPVLTQKVRTAWEDAKHKLNETMDAARSLLPKHE